MSNGIEQNNKLGRSYWNKMLTVFLFLLIPTVLLVIFTYIPAANMIGYSFEERDQFGVNVTFVGLKNYKTVFTTCACAVFSNDTLFQNTLFQLF